MTSPLLETPRKTMIEIYIVHQLMLVAERNGLFFNSQQFLTK